MTEPELSPNDSLESCKKIARSIEDKADKYKRMSKTLTLGIAASAAAIPVVIGLPINDEFVVRTLPSLLAAASALAAVVLQIEKPQERWNLYRRYQRILEGEQVLFRAHAGIYRSRHRETRLAARVAKIQLDLHDEWSGLVPRSADAALGNSGLGGLRA